MCFLCSGVLLQCLSFGDKKKGEREGLREDLTRIENDYLDKNHYDIVIDKIPGDECSCVNFKSSFSPATINGFYLS